MGGTWSEVFNDGSFFRVSGGDSENKTREAGIADTMTGRINGVQKDAIRNITGTVNPLVNDAAVMGMTGYNGAITSNTPSTSTRRADYSGSASAYAGGITFNASSVVPTASENRPVNRLIKVWQRTA